MGLFWSPNDQRPWRRHGHLAHPGFAARTVGGRIDLELLCPPAVFPPQRALATPGSTGHGSGCGAHFARSDARCVLRPSAEVLADVQGLPICLRSAHGHLCFRYACLMPWCCSSMAGWLHPESLIFAGRAWPRCMALVRARAGRAWPWVHSFQRRRRPPTMRSVRPSFSAATRRFAVIDMPRGFSSSARRAPLSAVADAASCPVLVQHLRFPRRSRIGDQGKAGAVGSGSIRYSPVGWWPCWWMRSRTHAPAAHGLRLISVVGCCIISTPDAFVNFSAFSFCARLPDQVPARQSPTPDYIICICRPRLV